MNSRRKRQAIHIGYMAILSFALLADSTALSQTNLVRDEDLKPVRIEKSREAGSSVSIAENSQIHKFIDSDGDGLSDDFEDSIGTNPYDADSDDDGLSDGDERCGKGLVGLAGKRFFDDLLITDPLNPDTDGDGVPDGTECGVQSPLLGSDGLRDEALESSDGTFTGNSSLGLRPSTFEFTYDYEGTEQLQLRHCYRRDSDPDTITNPTLPDTNSYDRADGIDDFDHSDVQNYNKETNYDGKKQEWETDPVLGIYPGFEMSPVKSTPNAIWIEWKPTESFLKSHPVVWGSEHFFDLGSSDFHTIHIRFKHPDLAFADPNSITIDPSSEDRRIPITFYGKTFGESFDSMVHIDLYDDNGMITLNCYAGIGPIRTNKDHNWTNDCGSGYLDNN